MAIEAKIITMPEVMPQEALSPRALGWLSLGEMIRELSPFQVRTKELYERKQLVLASMLVQRPEEMQGLVDFLCDKQASRQRRQYGG